MKIITNLLPYVPGHSGFSSYVRRVMPGLPGPRLLLGADDRAICRDDDWLPEACPGSWRLALLHRLSLVQHGVDPIAAMLQAGIRFEDLQAVYSPYCDALLALSKVKQVITCHDLTPLYVSNSLKASLRYRFWTPRHLSHASRVIAISHFVADQLVDFGVPARKIEVIYNGIGIERKPIDGPASKDLLMLARHDRNKNVNMVVRAFGQLLQRRTNWPGRLVIVGRPGRQTRELMGIVAQLPRPERVVILHGVNSVELVNLLRVSFALVSASCMEGFDYPVLEAKAEGLPTIISNISVHSEIHAGSSLFFDVDGIESLATAIESLEGDHSLWKQLSTAGSALASSLSIEDQQFKIKSLLAEE